MWCFEIVGKVVKPRALKIILSSSFDFNIYLEKGLVFSPIGTNLVRPIFLESLVPNCSYFFVKTVLWFRIFVAV